MVFKFKWLLNAILAFSVLILALSGLALFFQIWIEGIREVHKLASILFVSASLVHIILNRKALWLSLKTKTAVITLLLVFIVFLLPFIQPNSTKKAPRPNAQMLSDHSLPAPHQTGGKPLMQALKERQSIREYADKKLSDQILADLLWAGFGINRQDSGKRTAPSARNWQEIELYVVTAEGAYVYDPKANCLHGVAQGDQRPVTGMQGFVATAPLVLVYVADHSKAPAVPAAEWSINSGIDTGFISQNVYLFCASEGLATVVLGTVDRNALAAVLKLPTEKSIVLTQPVGYPE